MTKVLILGDGYYGDYEITRVILVTDEVQSALDSWTKQNSAWHQAFCKDNQQSNLETEEGMPMPDFSPSDRESKRKWWNERSRAHKNRTLDLLVEAGVQPPEDTLFTHLNKNAELIDVEYEESSMGAISHHEFVGPLRSRLKDKT